jgi:hypothetical protein
MGWLDGVTGGRLNWWSFHSLFLSLFPSLRLFVARILLSSSTRANDEITFCQRLVLILIRRILIS